MSTCFPAGGYGRKHGSHNPFSVTSTAEEMDEQLRRLSFNYWKTPGVKNTLEAAKAEMDAAAKQAKEDAKPKTKMTVKKPEPVLATPEPAKPAPAPSLFDTLPAESTPPASDKEKIWRRSKPINSPKTTPNMTLKTTLLPRKFIYNGAKIPDPNPEMTMEQVRDLLNAACPEILTAAVSGPEDAGRSLRYTFTRAIGSKGSRYVQHSKDWLLGEFANLAQKPLTPNEERLRRHLEFDKCVKLCLALAEAVQPYRNQAQRVLDARTELLAPLL